jgi:hypothetical protein
VTHSAEHTARGSGASECISVTHHLQRAAALLSAAVDNLCQKVRGVLIADITFNRAGGGASQLWALSIANQVTGHLALCLRPLMAIYALSRKSWKSFGCRYISINQTHNGESAQVVMGPLNIHRRLLPCKSIIIWACDQRASSFTLRPAAAAATAAPLFVAAPLVCNYSCCHIGDSHTIVLQFSAAARGRAHTHTHSLSFEYKARESFHGTEADGLPAINSKWVQIPKQC